MKTVAEYWLIYALALVYAGGVLLYCWVLAGVLNDVWDVPIPWATLEIVSAVVGGMFSALALFVLMTTIGSAWCCRDENDESDNRDDDVRQPLLNNGNYDRPLWAPEEV